MTWTWAKRRVPPPPLPLFHCRPSFVGKVYLQGIILYPICPINSLFIWSLSYEFKKHILYIVLWSPVPCPTQLKWWFRVWQALLFHDGCCQLSWWWGKGGWLVAFLLQLATGRILGWDTPTESHKPHASVSFRQVCNNKIFLKDISTYFASVRPKGRGANSYFTLSFSPCCDQKRLHGLFIKITIQQQGLIFITYHAK